MDYVLGKDCKAYCEGSLLTRVRKVTLSGETGEADVSTRASGGWKAIAATLRGLQAEIEMVYKSGDAGYEALRDAWLAGTEKTLTFLTAADGEGPTGEWTITNMSRSEELEEGVVVTFTAKLVEFDEWLTSGLASGS